MSYREEYPRPQFERKEWQNLNGKWEFAFDDDDMGMNEKWYKGEAVFDRVIQVPFVYQAKLSGIRETLSHEIVWYKRNFHVKKEAGKEILLHFGAVDYEARVFINGEQVICHEGGHTPFEADITDYLKEDGEQIVVVRVYDPAVDEWIPRGKQFWEKEPRGIWYTNSTGIWQSVWLESVSEKRIETAAFTTRFEEGKENIVCKGKKTDAKDFLVYKVWLGTDEIISGRINWKSDVLDFDVDLIQNHIFRTNFHDAGIAWTPETPILFDVELKLVGENDRVFDTVKSYFGFRKIHTEQQMVYLNNKPYYQKLVLDQGYWPDGLLTAPTDEDFKKDIELAKEMGFNGCRKHQKMEDPRFLYWADRSGYLVWGESASVPMYSSVSAQRQMKEWSEIINRDYNHPCIITWVPLNESWGVKDIRSNRMQQHFSQAMYHYLHALDPTRLVVSNDGWEMTETDICAIHNYSHGQKEENGKYNEYCEMLRTTENLLHYPPSVRDIYAKGFQHQKEPILLTEFGGVGFASAGEAGWGYTSVADEKEFVEEYERIMKAVYASEGLWGFCYTQLCDVEQEINGMLTYWRKPKCSLEKIRQINEMYHLSRIH